MATPVPDVTLCFSGVRLEQLCQGGGQCIDKDRSHYCVCPEGRTGSYCEHEVDPCTAQPCQHGGTCRGYMGGYVCEVSVHLREREEKPIVLGCISVSWCGPPSPSSPSPQLSVGKQGCCFMCGIQALCTI